MEKKMRISIVLMLAVALTASIAQAQDITTDLVGYWAFEDGTGSATAADSGPNGYHGTLVGTPTWGNGPEDFGGALFFDAGISGDGVECGTAVNPGGIFTLAIWAYWDGSTALPDSTSVHFMTKSDGWGTSTMMWQWELWPSRGGDYNDRIGISSKSSNSIILSSDAMPADEWVHLTITYDGTNAALFINGLIDKSLPFIVDSGTNAGFHIGKAGGTNVKRSFAGYLDEARVYSRVLTTGDIAALISPDPDFNAPPQVEAGDYQSLSWTQTHTAQLDATVSDDGKPYQESPPAEPCTPVGLTLTWTQISGPGVVTFDPCNAVEDPIATFTAAGFYELRLRGYDGEKDACDVVRIYIRPNNDPIAYWDFEEGTGSTVNDSANNNDGIFAGTSDPNWVDGWIEGGTNKALEFYGNGSRVEIAADGTIDPNLDNLTYEITIASWVNVANTDCAWAGIITRSDSSWRLAMRDQDRKFHFAVGVGSGSRCINGEIEVGLGEWHHVAGVYDGLELRLYVDGALDVTGAHTGGIALTDYPVWLGANSEHPDDTSTFAGKIDDTRIYGYALSVARIQELVAMGMGTIPTVNAGEDATFYVQNNQFQLDGTLTDDSPPTATLEWTQESGPGTAVFSNNTIEDPTVTFSELGDYVLRLTADDVLGSVFDEVTITVEDPVCDDVVGDGLLIPADISGPGGTPDCRVDLYDFAEFAGNWLRCNDPQDSECEFPL